MNAFANRNNEVKVNKYKKVATIAGVSTLALIIGAQCILTVDKGHVAVKDVFGKIDHTVHYKEGIHFVNPLASFTHVPITDQSINRIGIVVNKSGRAFSNGKLVLQTADKMTTAVDVEILVQMDPAKASYFVQQAGTFNGAVSKYISPALLESLYKQGSAIQTAQELFTSSAKDVLKQGTMKDMQSYLNSKDIMGSNLVGGFVIKDVKYQRMVLPPEIEKMIMATKQRQEQEDIALSSEKIRQTEADAKFYEEQQAAKAQKERADAEAHRRKALAEATEKEADAKLYAMQKEAEGIKKLNESINPQYINYMNAQASVTAAEKYQGGVPHTMMGEGQFVPFMNIGK